MFDVRKTLLTDHLFCLHHSARVDAFLVLRPASPIRRGRWFLRTRRPRRPSRSPIRCTPRSTAESSSWRWTISITWKVFCLQPGTFKVYLYDAYTKPLPADKVRKASGTLQIGDADDAPIVPLVVAKDHQNSASRLEQGCEASREHHAFPALSGFKSGCQA